MPKGFTGDDKDVIAKFVFYYTSAGAMYRIVLYCPIFDRVSFAPHSQCKTAHETEFSHNTKQRYGSGTQTCSPKQSRNWNTRNTCPTGNTHKDRKWRWRKWSSSAPKRAIWPGQPLCRTIIKYACENGACKPRKWGRNKQDRRCNKSLKSPAASTASGGLVWNIFSECYLLISFVALR
jgi:hypothetical protein